MNTLPYTNVVGSIMYTMVCTRPDLAYSLSILSRFMANPRKPHLDALKWVLRYLKDTLDYGICYKQGTKSAERVNGYTNSNYVGCLHSKISFRVHLYFLWWSNQLESMSLKGSGFIKH